MSELDEQQKRTLADVLANVRSGSFPIEDLAHIVADPPDVTKYASEEKIRSTREVFVEALKILQQNQ